MYLFELTPFLAEQLYVLVQSVEIVCLETVFDDCHQNSSGRMCVARLTKPSWTYCFAFSALSRAILTVLACFSTCSSISIASFNLFCLKSIKTSNKKKTHLDCLRAPYLHEIIACLQFCVDNRRVIEFLLYKAAHSWKSEFSVCLIFYSKCKIQMIKGFWKIII